MREETLHQNHEESPPTAADSELGGASGGGAGGAETELGELGIGEGSSGVAVGGGGGGGGAVPVGGNRVKGPWSPEEDEVLTRLVGKFGARNWSLIARGIPGRSGKSCRLRWCNQLDPCLKRKPFTGNLRFYFVFPVNVAGFMSLSVGLLFCVLVGYGFWEVGLSAWFSCFVGCFLWFALMVAAWCLIASRFLHCCVCS